MQILNNTKQLCGAFFNMLICEPLLDEIPTDEENQQTSCEGKLQMALSTLQ
jgi:hypothetical protein